MIKKEEVAKGVRVRFNDTPRGEYLGLEEEPVLFIADGKIYEDEEDEPYVRVKGGSNSFCHAYLGELDLEFPVPETPMYSAEEDMTKVEVALLLQERDLIEKRLSEIDPNLLMNHELNRYNQELKGIGFDKDQKKFKD